MMIPKKIETVYRQDLTFVEGLWGHRETFLGRARQGDQEARHALLHSLLPIILAYAVSMQMDGISSDVMELVCVGNYVTAEKLDDALQKPNPCGFLLKWAKGEMKQHCYRYRDAITPPTTPGDERYTMLHILDGFDTDEFDIEERSSRAFEDTPLHKAIHEALAVLTEYGRETIKRIFGLDGYGTETIRDVAGEKRTSRVYGATKQRKYQQLAKMREFLEQRYPYLVASHVSSQATNNFYANTYETIIIPECTMRKLRDAERQLRGQGEVISMNKLRQLSGVNTRYASAYLYRSRKQESLL